MTARPTVPMLGLAPRAAIAVLFGAGILVGLPSGFGVLWFVPRRRAAARPAVTAPAFSEPAP